MSGWCIRIARLEGYDELISSLKDVDDYGRILAVAHRGDKTDKNPHVHIVLSTEVKEKALRKRMNTMFKKGKGNGHISIKPWDGSENALSYLFHEEDGLSNVVINKGHTVNDIQRYVEMNQKVQVLVNEAKKKASWRLEEIVLEYYLKNEGPECCPSELDVGCRIMETALQNGIYPPQDWLLKGMTMKIVYQLSNLQSKESMILWHVKRALRLD